MNAQTKRKALFFMLVSLILMIIIAAGLKDLKLEPGVPFASKKIYRQVPEMTVRNSKNSVSLSASDKTVFIIILAAGFFWLTIQMIKKLGWKTMRDIFILILLGSMVITGIFLPFILFHPAVSPIRQQLQAQLAENTGKAPDMHLPVYIIRFLCILLAVFAVFTILWFLNSRKRPSKMEKTLELEAELARSSLLKGGNFKDVITRCYRQMSIALEEEQGIVREESMTAGEFEAKLDATGAPPGSVRTLTRLFEAVRYGNREPSSADEQRAIGCFEAIVKYFRIKNEGKKHERH